MLSGSSINPSQFQCFLFLERMVDVLNEIIYLKVAVTQKAAFAIIINLRSELPLRDFRLVFSRRFLARFPLLLLLPFCLAFCFLAVPSPLIYLFLYLVRKHSFTDVRSRPGSDCQLLSECNQSKEETQMRTDRIQSLKKSQEDIKALEVEY